MKSKPYQYDDKPKGNRNVQSIQMQKDQINLETEREF